MTDRIAELEARIAELREALELAWDKRYELADRKELAKERLSRPDDFSALNEAKAKTLEEAALLVNAHDIREKAVVALRRRAQEIREGK